MNKFFKTTTILAGIGMIAYTVYVLTRYVLHEYFGVHYVYNLATDIRLRLIYDILPLSMLTACCGLWKYRPAKEASKSFRIFTVCLFVALVGTLAFSPLYTVYVAGMKYIYPSIYWRALILISGIIWLFMLRKQPIEEASPRSYRVTLIVAALLLAFPIILEIISGISCLCTGYVLCLASGSIKAWVRWIAPTLVLIHFAFPQIKAINTTRNTHCLPGSFDERAFKRNRTITLIVAGIAIAALCLGSVGFIIGKRLYFRNMLYHTVGEIAFICFCIAFLALFISWIMLSIMAFRQLPNPRGYKIYNIVCQVLTCGSLVPAIFAPSNFDVVFGVLFLLSFSAFFITTTIRVISYSLPKPLEQ